MIEFAGFPRNHRPLTRAIRWGSCAAFSLVALAIASHSDTANRQLELALFGAPATPATPDIGLAAIKSAAPPANVVDADKLAEQVRLLSADRDRLSARVASLEQNFNDITGSIARMRSAATAASPLPPVATTTPPAIAAPASVPAEDLVTANIMPKIAAIAAPAIDTPRVLVPLAMPGASPEGADWRAEPQTTASTPAAPSEPVPAEATPAAEPIRVNVPLPKVRVAVAHAPKPAPPPRAEFAIDIGGSITTGNIAGQWAAVKANHGPMLVGLKPVIGRDARFGRVPYRLLLGPLQTSAAAVKLCARFAEAGVECHLARYEGEQMAQF